MGEVINLRLVRKAKARAGRALAADANRVAHGAVKSERDAATATRRRLERKLDGACREE